MENSIIQRITDIITSKGFSENSFAKQIGSNQRTINQQLRGDRRLSLDTVCNVISSFEDISAEWLLRGEGEMLKKKTDQEASGNTLEAEKSFLEKEFFYLKAIRDKNADLIKAMDKIEEKEKEILRLKAEIESLKGMLDKQKVV